PPAPNTVARPTTLGACQVRLQLSTLFVCSATRANFCVAKFSSFVVLEQLKTPVSAPWSSARRKPAAARSSASSQLAVLSSPPSRTSGWASRVNFGDMLRIYRTTHPHRGTAPKDVLVGQSELVLAGEDLLRAKVEPARHDRLEQRRVLHRGAQHVGGGGAVE